MSITIIGGELGGRKLLPVAKDHPLRPILARIKKSVFDIIKLRIPDSNFLDLFAGTGAVGIEAISRGSKLAVFVDSASAAIKMIEKNLQQLGIEKFARIYQRDVTFNLGWLSNVTKKNYFDVIFMGPPYKALCVNSVLKLIKEAELLKEDGLIVAQHHIKEKVGSESFNVVREEKYGDTLVTFLKNT